VVKVTIPQTLAPGMPFPASVEVGADGRLLALAFEGLDGTAIPWIDGSRGQAVSEVELGPFGRVTFQVIDWTAPTGSIVAFVARSEDGEASAQARVR